MRSIDIAPFALPAAPAGEYWFEEARDIREVVVSFRGPVPAGLKLEYWRNHWPQTRVEGRRDLENPAQFGWTGTDDWFNGVWQRARVTRTATRNTVSLRFRGLNAEKLDQTPPEYDVEFRRTMGVRLLVSDWSKVRQVAIHTCSAATRTTLRVEMDAGRRTRGKSLGLSAYNSVVDAVSAGPGVAPSTDALPTRRGSGTLAQAAQQRQESAAIQLSLSRARRRSFGVTVSHMQPAHRYAGDDGLVEFHLDHDTFTVSLEALREQGPIWYAEEGIYMASADDPTSFAAYRAQHSHATTVNQQIAAQPEHSLARAFHGQPRPHAVPYSLGCKHSPQRFWLEPNGDLVLHKRNVTWLDAPGVSARKFCNKGNARFFFGLEHWVPLGRYTDPPPVPIYNLRLRQDRLELEQRTLCVPLSRSITTGELTHDEPTVGLIRLRVTNAGDKTTDVELPIHYSEDSGRQTHAQGHTAGQTDYLVPRSPAAPLTVKGDALTGRYKGRTVVRALISGTLKAAAHTRLADSETGSSTSRLTGPATLSTSRLKTVTLRARLRPGQICEAVIKIPYLAPQDGDEMAALRALDFATCEAEVAAFWREDTSQGAQLRCPVQPLNTLHTNHQIHTEITDFVMPDDPHLINTSVGTSTYGNFSNESCMIVQELEQRGLGAEARRRLELWVKYQGSVPQPGNFSDYDGMYFGAGGFEHGSYNQHHGWVLWAVSEHFLIWRDQAWFSRVADSIVDGADWVFRQRRLTMEPLPHSRGWERGFLPAGSLEDVTEFYYWLSTNCLTWRGVDTAARALEAAHHPEAGRVRTEAEAYRQDLIAGLETMRQHGPLVRLRDGRWVPHYPSRAYCRGRDQGWIREVLEGAVYLMLSGLYDPNSREAGWILDDFQDNLYLTPPNGYVLNDLERTLCSRGGFSIQPCLLAGLLPHLERDEPEIFLWMLFNAIAAVYRDEISGMIEHPMPELGFSNAVSFKTSDEANAVMWLRYAYVYWNDALLHFGRALPRAWFAQEQELSLVGLQTHFGPVSVRYQPDPGGRRIRAEVDLSWLREPPDTVMLRFRTPGAMPLRAVRINGRKQRAHGGEDVDIGSRTGKVIVQVEY